MLSAERRAQRELVTPGSYTTLADSTHKLSEIMVTASCSKAYASTIRKGTYVPHVSTWPALAELAGVVVAEMATH